MSRWIRLHHAWLRCTLAVVLTLLGLASGPAQAQTAATSRFDHLATGFPLQDAHAQARCESCHQGGVLRGTPRDCASCHAPGRRLSAGNTVTPATHLPTQQTCDTCHGTRSFSGARFRHVGVVPGSCQTCHNGVITEGKTAQHIPTSASCDSCHRSNAWLPARGFDHAGVVPGTCQTCHNGSRATGKNAQHIPTGTASSCDSCHGSTSRWTPTRFDHTQTLVTGQCASCHNGAFPPADGKPSNHVPYTAVPVTAAANCDGCHKNGTTTWTGARVHANYSLSTSCASCHSGAYPDATGKPTDALHAGVTGNCESCHKSTSNWASAKVDHSTFNAATNCASCHNGSAATGKPATHIPTGAATCFSCHGTTGWTPTKWNHSQVPVTAQCASCHNGAFPPADGKPSNHVPYTAVPVTAAANCDGCHKNGTTTWTGARVHANYSLSTSCASCHSGAYPDATGKPTDALHAGVTGNCESCHKSTSNWASAKVDHSTFNAATNCASCHNGSAATGKPATHIPTGAATCFSCHGTTGWTPTKWNHSQVPVTAQCASCHNGAFPPADGKPSNHVPYTAVPVTAAANCDGCHKNGTTTWTGARVHANYSLSTSCASCHSGAYPDATGKPTDALHAGVTGNCESCHKSTSNWASAKVDHSTFNAATNCASCHNGSAATGKPATHIPTGAATCFSCHGTTGWTPTKWNHSQVPVTAQCASCHNGAFPPADGKPGNHVPYTAVPVTAAANCDGCHKNGTTTWTGARVHANYSLSTSCASCHSGAYPDATGKPADGIHATITGNCESCHKSTSSWSNVNFAHSAANAVGTGTCDTCHNGSTATGKPANHIPVPVGTARCDSCHRSQTSWTASVSMNHSVVTTASCKSCHGGAFTGAGATAKPSNHIPEVQLLAGASMDCKACHTSTTSWGGMRMNHNNSQGNGAGWCKACHDRSTAWLGDMEKKSLTHERSTGVTDCSQSGCHRPLGNKGSPYTRWE
ncbi:MAG: hypothetical protein H6933_11285 [Burkholderiaceae bacterium]|nr:hypothetical protein [Burkholderiaceae bacterium]